MSAEVEPAVVELGRRLFFDPRLSRSGNMSCATCHRPELAFTDGRARAVGDAGTELERNTPTLLNRALGGTQFWDGRAVTLAEQALGPLLSQAEMNLDRPTFAERFATEADRAGFAHAFGASPSIELTARAIAAFEATLVTADSAFDRHEWAGERGAISELALRGLELFRGRARCTTCHVGPNLTDERFHDIGLASDDPGRAAVTSAAADHGKFKTPSLREVALTAPYMHDGRLTTLADVVAHYDRGGDATPNRSIEIRPLSLNELERTALVAFLESLSGAPGVLDPALFDSATHGNGR